MEKKILEIINIIRSNKGMDTFSEINGKDSLRNDIGFNSFDLAELTVRIEDEFSIDIFENGLVSTVDQIFEKLQK